MSCVIPVYARAGDSTKSQARASRKAAKKQQKATKKYATAQRKTQRKMEKQARKNTHYPKRTF